MRNSLRWHVLVLVCATAGLAGSAEAKGLHEQVFFVPAPAGVKIDGDLGDWDRSGGIESCITPETRAMRSMKFYGMHDDQAIYLAAEVNDLSPMMNAHDPAVNVGQAWDADSFQFRIYVKPTLKPERATSDRTCIHTQLWYYTHGKKAYLSVGTGWDYRPRQGWKDGVAPDSAFQGVFKMRGDKAGYFFEYRIPWASLSEEGLKLKAGDKTRATFNCLWGTVDGTKTGGAGSWLYEVMSTQGFPYQSPASWGTAIFSEKGNLAPAQAGLGEQAEPPTPLRFEYNLEKDGIVTICLLDAKGSPIRHVVAAQNRQAGRVVESWDGLDDKGDPLPAGTYRWKGLRHDPIQVKWLLSVHNSGKPGYPTEDGRGGWGGDHSLPTGVCRAGTSEIMILGWDVCEAGWSLLAVHQDGPPRLWGEKFAVDYVVADNETIYATGQAAGTKGLYAVRLKDKTRLPFTESGGFAQLPAQIGDVHSQVGGLAMIGGTLYVSFGNAIAEIDKRTGKLLRTLGPLAGPVGAVAARDGKTLFAIIGGKLVIVAAADGKVAPFADANMDEPHGLAVGPDGGVFVANRGKLHNVSLFDRAGKYLRSIGKPGGRPTLGKWDPTGMYNPHSIALDAKGRLWVMEEADYPKRQSVWDVETGRLVSEYFGGCAYSTMVGMDPNDPTRAYCHGVQWKVDLDAGTSEPESVVLHEGNFRVFTAPNGRQYAAARWNLLIRGDDGIFHPVKVPNLPTGYWGRWYDENLIAYGSPQNTAKVYRLRPERIDQNGIPVYDAAKVEAIGPDNVKGQGNYAMADPETGDIYALAGGIYGEKKWPGLCKYSNDGQLVWGLWTVGTDWFVALNRGIPPKGRSWGTTRWMGMDDQFIVALCYMGTIDIWTKDGIYVDKIYNDGRLGILKQDTVNAEFFFGSYVKTKDGRRLVLAGDQDGRINELTGLDTIDRMAGSCTLSDADVKLAAAERAAFDQGAAREQAGVIHKLAGLDWADASFVRRYEGEKGFRAALAYDDASLAVRYVVDSPSPLVNAAGEPDLIFHNGNCIDIELQTDPAADPHPLPPLQAWRGGGGEGKREKAGTGDVRLIITRQGGKPVCIGYFKAFNGSTGQPKVLRSPTGTEEFAAIRAVPAEIDYAPHQGGFTATVKLPLKDIGLSLKPGQKLRLDLGYRFGDTAGQRAGQRLYWKNRSALSGII